jgi:hypothetical protein
MAIFNEILVGRYNRGLQKLCAIKGSPPVRQLSGEVGATIEIENCPIELRYLFTVDSFMTSVTQVGVAGQFSTIKLRNPVNSNIIAIFEKISVISTLADSPQVGMGTNQVDGATVVPIIGSNNLDARSGRVSSLIFSTSGAAAPPGQQLIATVGSGATVQDVIASSNQEIILSPGRSIQVQAQVANQQLIVTYKWRERLLEESERT